MKLFVGVTNNEWFRFLAERNPDEVNFWRPRSQADVKALTQGDVFLFKLHSPLDFIAGGGIFVSHRFLPLPLVWQAFGENNGVPDFETFERRILEHRSREELSRQLGCTILVEPFFWPRELWIPMPSDWSKNIVTGKGYDISAGIGAMLWADVQSRRTEGVSAGVKGSVAEAIERYGAPMTIRSVLLWFAIPCAGMAQSLEPFGVKDKLGFHVASTASPLSLAESAAYAGILQGFDAPREWGQGGGAYGKRLASTLAGSAIQSTLAFGLDSALHQDPRYFRSRQTGLWRRTGHALRGTILTHTDRGGETLSIWRLGSGYGAAFLSNQWYPDRLNTVRLGALQGTMHLGFDFVNNLGVEFWPDFRRAVLHRRDGVRP